LARPRCSHVWLTDIVEYPRSQHGAIKGGTVFTQGHLVACTTINELEHGFGQALLSDTAQIGNVDGPSQTGIQTRVHDCAGQTHVTSLSGAIVVAPVVAVLSAVVIDPEDEMPDAY
jgi:hypothetical protein